MNSPNPTKVYWDSCVFLSLIEGTPGRLPHIESVLDEAEKGRITICTSVFSIAEVAFAKSEKDGKALDPSIEKKINGLWSTDSPFELSEVYRTLTVHAQTLVRTAMVQGIRLTPPDAIHFATALRIGASEFQTYDEFKGKSKELEKLTGIKIIEPSVSGKIVWPATGAEPKKRAKKKSRRKMIRKTDKKGASTKAKRKKSGPKKKK